MAAVIRNRLWRANHQEAIGKFVADLRSEAGVQENPELLSKLRLEVKKKCFARALLAEVFLIASAALTQALWSKAFE